MHAEPLTIGIPIAIISTEPELLDRARSQIARFGGQRFIGEPFGIEVLLAAVDDRIGAE